MTMVRSAVLACVFLSACQDVSAPVARIKVFSDRHGPHMRAIAEEMAPRCPAALASAGEGAVAAVPTDAALSEPPTSIPFGSLIKEANVLQVAVTCSSRACATRSPRAAPCFPRTAAASTSYRAAATTT
jgi:hypothetical protein